MNEAADDYDEARPGLGDDFLEGVERAISIIVDAPHRWPRVDRRHHRFVLRRFPYSIFYRFNETEVIVVAVAHHRQRPRYWSGRR
jgi:plasmid stabilization system protein ParE